MDRKDILLNKQRIVIKVGTSTITYEETGNINLEKLEKFVRILINLRNKGKEVIVVSSGAVGVGKNALGMDRRPQTESEKQACAAVGQGKLMMIYEKLFNEYGQLTAQVLLTKESVTNAKCRKNAKQTFDELFKMQVVPIVNENDAISVDELSYGNFGDNDTLAAYVSRLVDADLLILMSDIDGLYTDDPRKIRMQDLSIRSARSGGVWKTWQKEHPVIAGQGVWQLRSRLQKLPLQQGQI